MSLGDVRLISFARKLSLWISGCWHLRWRTVVDSFGSGACAWEREHGIFGLRTFAWELSSGNSLGFPRAHWADVVLSSLCPPRRWSGEVVGIGILIGIKGFLEIPKVQKVDFPEIPRIQADKQSNNMIFQKYKNPRGLHFLTK